MVTETRTDKIVLVVGVDLSDLSEHLVRTTRGLLGSGENAEIHLVHVLTPQYMPNEVMTALPALGPSARVAAARAEERIEVLARELAAITAANVECYVAMGDPAAEIITIAERVAADVIVIEAHGRHGLRRIFHRSVAARLARDAPCSVLTIRPRGTQSVHPPPPEPEAAHPRMG